MKFRVLPLLAVLVLVGSVASVYAQNTAEIYGKVTDASGAIMPGATVTLTSPVLLQPLTAVTTETGSYRFPGLGVGTYTIKFELPGFKTVVKEGYRLQLAESAQVNQSLEISTVQETVTVTGETPLVDLRDTSKTNRFTQEALQGIPSARDPWVIIEQSAGVAMDRQNVGGSASGQQSNFVARGANFSQQKWNLDGVDITDMTAVGGSPVYFDFDAFEEMQVSTGGSDVTMQSPGVAVNVVTKSGTDKIRGSGRFYVTDDAFESVNVSDEMRAKGATSGNPIQNIKDFGVEAGGPIQKGRAWIWGSYGKQNVGVGVNNFFKPDTACQAMKADLKADPLSHSVKDVWGCLNTDLTTLNNYNLKVAYQVVRQNQFTFLYNAAEKVRNARDASDTRPIETTWRQGAVLDESLGSSWWKTGMPKTYKFSDRHIFSDRLMVEVSYAHVGNNFVLDFHDPSLADVQATYDQNTGMYTRSYYAQSLVRPTDSFDVTGNYFVPGFLGGDNAFKFGFKMRNDEGLTLTHYGGNAFAVFANGVPYQAWIFRDGLTDYFLKNRSFYVQDGWSRRQITINAGFRWDYQTDRAASATVEQVPFYGQTTRYGQVFNQLPSVTFNGADAGIAWKNFSPRFGVTYDLTGNGRNVAKFNFSRYVNQLGNGNLSSVYNPVKVIEVDYPWADLNGDKTVQANEIDMSAGKPAFATSGYDYNNPTLLTTTGTVSPDLTAPVTNEVILSFDKQVGNQFAVSASYIYRKYSNFTGTFRNGLKSSDYTPVQYTPAATACPTGARCPTVTYYQPTFQLPVATTLINIPDYSRQYQGFEVTARKRMSNNWMMNASYAFNSTTQYYSSPDSYQDPTNIDKLDGQQYAEQSSSSGLDNVYPNAKWVFRMSGVYTLPWWQINLAAFYNARQGYPFLAVVQTPSRPFGAGSTTVYLDNYGSVRLPNFQTTDFRVDKVFTFAGRIRATASMDVFNLFNGSTILSQRRTQNASNANQISSILAPRVLRFGVRVTF
jgi:hypothetical protein